MRVESVLVVLAVSACGVPPVADDALETSDVHADLAAAPARCTPAQLADLLAPATAAEPRYVLTCNATLPRTARVTKVVSFAGPASSNVVLDCNGATLAPADEGVAVWIHSQRENNQPRPVAHAVVRNCHIEGSVRVRGGMTSEEYRDSAGRPGHTERAQAAAPHDILLEGLTIHSHDAIPLYVHPGSVRVTLRNSHLSGATGEGPGLYLDAESTGHVIVGNTFNVNTGREVLAVDGSSFNLIAENVFHSVRHGGVFLYRNCGEAGVPRHQTPNHNQLINNYFEGQGSSAPLVWLASRNGNRSYCGEDSRFPVGSGVDNLDHATHNLVAQNQFLAVDEAAAVKVSATPNVVTANERVTRQLTRDRGCGLLVGDDFEYVASGRVFGRRDLNDSTRGTRWRCADGSLTSTRATTTLVGFTCQRDGSNSGCQEQVACPGNRVLVGLRAACNLEASSLPSTEPASRRWDTLTVVRAADGLDGACVVGASQASSGAASLADELGSRSSVSYGCHERDANGGDCLIRGQALCL